MYPVVVHIFTVQAHNIRVATIRHVVQGGRLLCILFPVRDKLFHFPWN
jgi:hypothetical protein